MRLSGKSGAELIALANMRHAPRFTK